LFRGNWPIWIKQQLGSRNERCRNQFTIGGKNIKIFRNIEIQKEFFLKNVYCSYWEECKQPVSFLPETAVYFIRSSCYLQY